MANDTDRYSCYGCGLTDPETTCTLSSPFTRLAFDYSEDSLRTAQKIVEKGKSQLARLDEALAKLQARRDHLHAVIHGHQAYLAPISRLPEEILLLVFVEVRGTTQLTKGGVWALTAVSQRWRALALSSPRLWAPLVLDLVTVDLEAASVTAAEEREALLECRRARMHVERAGEQPLVLTCLLPDDEGECQHPYVKRSVRQLVYQLPRCGVLSMIGTGPSSWNIYPDGSPVFPRLHQLTYANSQRSRPHYRFPRFFDNTPVLDWLHMISVRPAQPIPQSWQALTSLKLDGCFATTAGLVELLGFTKGLIELSLRVIKLPEEYMQDPSLPLPPVPQDAALLPKLEVLDVDLAWTPEWTWTWDNPRAHERVIWASLPLIKCPNVNTISLSVPTSEALGVPAIQACMLTSNNPSSVTSISFNDLEDEHTTGHVMALISNLPSLSILSIAAQEKRWIDYGPLLAALRWPEQDKASSDIQDEAHESDAGQIGLCPQLQWLKLCRLQLESSLLRDLILSRSDNTSVKKLSFVTVDDVVFTDDPPASGDPFEWLEEMENEGILQGVDIREP